jgi:hypothetical protein
MSLMDFVVSPPGCGRSVTDFWSWDAHEAQLRCPDEVDGDIWIWSTGRDLNLSSTKLPRPWSPWESSPSRKNPHSRPGNRTRDFIFSSKKLWPLYHEAGRLLSVTFRKLCLFVHPVARNCGRTLHHCILLPCLNDSVMFNAWSIHYTRNKTKKMKIFGSRAKKEDRVVYWKIKSFEIVSKTKYY